MKTVKFRLINDSHEAAAAALVDDLSRNQGVPAAKLLLALAEKIRADIPEKKRISYGRYSVIKELGLFIFPLLTDAGIDCIEFGKGLFDDAAADPFVKSLGLQLMSIAAGKEGPESAGFAAALDYFELSAAADDWILRECTAGFIRKLVQLYQKPMLSWYLMMVKSGNPMKRRFACESLRPVADNGWFKKNPDFPWEVIPHLFHEADPYPRTSAGNSLSDWMRVDQERTLPVVRELASNGDKNSYWIAHRACRNLVKKEPLLVMDLLGADEYVYKDRKFYRIRKSRFQSAI